MENEEAVPTEVAEVTEVKEEVPEVKPEETAEVEVPETPLKEELVPKKKTAQERIDEITKARREAEREAKYWRDQALKKEKEETPPAEPAVPIPTRPNLDQFETVELYEDALLAWHEKKRTAETQAETARKRTEEATRKFQENAAKLRGELEDFDEVIESPVFTPAMKVALLNADNGPAVAYYLGKEENRQIATKIASLPVEMQLYELGKLETQLLVAQKTKKVPGAPPPIKPVGIGGGGGGGEVDTSKMSDDEWFKYEQQQKILRMKKKTGG